MTYTVAYLEAFEWVGTRSDLPLTKGLTLLPKNGEKQDKREMKPTPSKDLKN
jgi:hypothetical protein